MSQAHNCRLRTLHRVWISEPADCLKPLILFTNIKSLYVIYCDRDRDLAAPLQVAEVFETAEKMGLKVVRVWAFSDGDTWNALQPRIGRIDEHVLR